MILYNTTFHVSDRLVSDFLTWLGQNYVGTALDAGLSSPALMKLVDHIEEGWTSFALHLYAPTVDDVRDWECGERQRLHTEIATKWGENVLSFSTPMEVLGL